MKWIDSTQEYMPPYDPGILLIKGYINRELKKEYQISEEPIEIEIYFYVLKWHMNYHRPEQEFSLDKALIIGIDSLFGDEEFNEIKDKFEINNKNIQNFIDGPWTYTISDFDKWINISDIKDSND